MVGVVFVKFLIQVLVTVVVILIIFKKAGQGRSGSIQDLGGMGRVQEEYGLHPRFVDDQAGNRGDSLLLQNSKSSQAA